MKNYLLKSVLISLLFMGNISVFAQHAGETDGYHLVWQDLFNQCALNTSVWNIEVNGNGGGNNELQYYTARPDNVTVGVEPVSGDSCLIITAKKESYSGKTCTSGRLTTQQKMNFKYGKIEARIKLPSTANGLWPAFWMMGDDVPFKWPQCGETDILEMGSSAGISAGTQDRYFNGAFHWAQAATGTATGDYAQSVTNPYSLQDDFHLYTLIWNANGMKMYLDLDKTPGKAPYIQMTLKNPPTPSVPNDPSNYFTKPFFVLVNLAIGGSFTGINNINNVTALNAANNYTAKMYIDYVKVYQLGTTDETYYGPALTAVTGVCLNKSTTTVSVGATDQLIATIVPSNAINKNVLWTSSNINVATVSDAGLVTAVYPGTTTITVTTQDGNKTATCIVTVEILDSVNNNYTENLKIYPNPVQNELNINGDVQFENLPFIILDLLGKQIVNGQWLNGQSINVENLASGVYFIKIQTDKGMVTKKFVKE